MKLKNKDGETIISAMTTKTKTILITGATDGIGLALAHHYRSRHRRLLLVGRRPFSEAPLQTFNPSDYCRADLAEPDCATLIERWLQTHKVESIDLVIHNAGLGYHGPTAQQSWDNVQALVNVNLWAPIALTHALLPRLAQSGKVVFISSVVSALACPDYAVYGATKAAIDGFARSLRIELGHNIKVQVIHPGATRTGMHVKSGLSRDIIDWERFPSAEAVAAEIAQAIERDRRSAAIGWSNRLLRVGGRYFGGFFDWVQRRQSR